MKAIYTFLMLSLTGQLVAQYATPGTGVVWNMDSLVLHSTIVQNTGTNSYLVTEDLTISASDSVFIIGKNVMFASDVLVTVTDAGLYVLGNSIANELIAENQGQNYKGFRLEGNSNVFMDNVMLSDCGGIKVLTPEFGIQNSTIESNPADINTSGFIELSSGKPKIINNSFKNNEVSAIASAANATVAPLIKNNVFYGNVSGNTNRPQINLSPSGANDTTVIEGNTITGVSSNEMAGGIAFSALAGGVGNVIIRDNEIGENRYGITILGNNLFALIEQNNIWDNNIQNAPFLGGSGINLSGDSSSLAVITDNAISGNLWGITVQQTFKVNMGDAHIGGSNPGLNTFRANINSGDTYALFNNTPNTIYATNNCWDLTKTPTLQHAEDVISHVVDDATLGEVFFDPIAMCTPVTIKELDSEAIHVYPNPVQNKLFIDVPSSLGNYTIELYTINGQNIPLQQFASGTEFFLDITSLVNGVYLLKIEGNDFVLNKKILKY
ncbi:MAG: T9SS type A sorting domain-containing protein [Flavobacteriales bacterium]|jgi:hypothetical protein|nr:T9SS type A sorting domain-containing protein [Flavobacteriales bacterium]